MLRNVTLFNGRVIFLEGTHIYLVITRFVYLVEPLRPLIKQNFKNKDAVQFLLHRQIAFYFPLQY